MAQLAKRYRRVFNLLRPQAPPPTSWDNIYEWLTGRARIVLLGLQVLIGIVFLFKVLVDVQLKAIDDQITKTSNDIKVNFLKDEPEFRKIQQQADSYVALWRSSSAYAALTREVTSLVRNPAAKITISFSDKILNIAGLSSREEVALIEQKIKSSNNFQNVELLEIKSAGNELAEGKGNFGLKALIKDDFVRKVPNEENK